MDYKSTAFSVPPKCQSYNILYRINILIGLTLINMFIKTKQISYSLEEIELKYYNNIKNSIMEEVNKLPAEDVMSYLRVKFKLHNGKLIEIKGI